MPNGALKLFSPAKINLFLNVLSKRPDGYHELETLFERIDLGDTITLKKTSGPVKLRTDSRAVPNGPENLVVKAAELLRRECGVREGVEIDLHKRIPVAAGLGGGSSNAASVLMGLNRLWGLRLPKRSLLKLGAKLGSDVPFFILGSPMAWGRGRGEILKPLGAPKKRLWHCIVKPPFGISTKQAYAGISRISLVPHVHGKRPGWAGLTPLKPNVRMLVRLLKKGDSEQLSSILTNSLELTLNKRVREISEIKKKLVLEGAFAALMTGSGSAVFGLFHGEKKARAAAARLKRFNKNWKVFVAATY